jgi:sarcosine oxidase
MYLARAGVQTFGFEQFSQGHNRGSSHGNSRIIRYTYPDPLYTHLMAQAYPLWNALEQEYIGAFGGEPGDLFVRCGGLYFGPETHPEMQAVAQTLRQVGLPHETLTAKEGAKRFPALRLHEGEVTHYQPESGFLRASACVQAHLQLAVRHGANVQTQCSVVGFDTWHGAIKIAFANGTNALFDRVIVTAGPWMTHLLPHLQLPLTVTRQQITYLPIRSNANPVHFAIDRLPVWIDAGSHWYGFPQDGVIPGVKLALHAPGEPFHPDMQGRPISEADSQAAIAYARERFPGLGNTPTHAQTCLYTNTPREDSLLDTVPGMPNVFFVSACSGHGFKFTTLMGKIAGEWATGALDRPELTRFRLPLQ